MLSIMFSFELVFHSSSLSILVGVQFVIVALRIFQCLQQSPFDISSFMFLKGTKYIHVLFLCLYKIT